MALVAAIGLINAFKRTNVMVRQPADDYQPGQWGYHRPRRPAVRHNADD